MLLKEPSLSLTRSLSVDVDVMNPLSQSAFVL